MNNISFGKLSIFYVQINHIPGGKNVPWIKHHEGQLAKNCHRAVIIGVNQRNHVSSRTIRKSVQLSWIAVRRRWWGKARLSVWIHLSWNGLRVAALQQGSECDILIWWVNLSVIFLFLCPSLPTRPSHSSLLKHKHHYFRLRRCV